MKQIRVILSVLALLAMPFVAAAAQGSSDGQANPNADNRCKTPAQAVRQDGQHRPATPTNQKNCPPQAPVAAPTGNNEVHGYVYQDDDASGSRNVYAGEMGLAGWTLQLNWNGQTIASTTTDAYGDFVFAGLGFAAYSVCVVPQGGFTQTQPADGSQCYAITFTGSFATWFDTAFFGMLPQ